jgi:hypothetical protein
VKDHREVVGFGGAVDDIVSGVTQRSLRAGVANKRTDDSRVVGQAFDLFGRSLLFLCRDLRQPIHVLDGKKLVEEVVVVRPHQVRREVVGRKLLDPRVEVENRIVDPSPVLDERANSLRVSESFPVVQTVDLLHPVAPLVHRIRRVVQ